jgi:hypothetical protein
MRAQNNSLSNDSVHAQFSDSVDSLGSATMRIGTSSSAEFVLQDGSGGPPDHGWGWTENGWGSLGPNVYFAADGNHTIRIQQREDGAIIDQIVISPYEYISSPPGPRQDDNTILPAAGGSGEPPPPPPSTGTIVLWTANAAASSIHGNWQKTTDASAAGGTALWNPDAGSAKIAPPLASPTNYFEMSFDADAGKAYHVWLRMRAQNNSLANDSVHLQYSDSVNSSGAAIARIGTSSSTEYVLQDGSGGPPDHGWGWTENGWGSLGPHLYFASSGTHTLRIQQREDGPIIDQIVISPDAYLTSAPGPRQDDGTILQAKGGASSPPGGASADTLVLWTGTTPAAGIHGSWQVLGDSTAAGGKALRNPNANAAKVAPALASPTSYFDMTFDADASRAYHVWVRMKAESNSFSNDSVHLQFSGTVNSAGTPIARIGSSDSLEFVLQNGSGGPANHGWGWTENGWGSFGSPVYFANTGEHRLRVQQREDGAVVDQIVISPDAYLNAAPGPRRDDATVLGANDGSGT